MGPHARLQDALVLVAVAHLNHPKVPRRPRGRPCWQWSSLEGFLEGLLALWLGAQRFPFPLSSSLRIFMYYFFFPCILSLLSSLYFLRCCTAHLFFEFGIDLTQLIAQCFCFKKGPQELPLRFYVIHIDLLYFFELFGFLIARIQFDPQCKRMFRKEFIKCHQVSCVGRL